MKNLDKKDIIYLWIINLIFLGIVFLLTKDMYLYGSELDWYNQHIPIPDYFRTLFYSTHDLFPDFAFNLGGGQNIYNYSYYGLLSPIVLLSYFFPNVKMSTFIITTIIIIVLISNFLIYNFLKSKKFSSETCLLATLLFAMSTPISLHSHRHYMFISYMPFLIMGLYGVDKKMNEGKGWLLTLSIFLMIMTSYYFSIGGIICLIIYAIYNYLKKMNKVTFKELFKFLYHLAIPFIIAVLSSCIITLPTIATLLYNRADSNVIINWKLLLLPNFTFQNIIYKSYGIGLTFIIIPALINFFKKKKENIFLGIVLLLFAIFDIFNYIFNGTMYIDSKSLIPFLPLYIFVLATFIEDIFNKKINYVKIIVISLIVCILILKAEYKMDTILIDFVLTMIIIIVYKFINKKIVLIVPFSIIAIMSCWTISVKDNLVLRKTSEEQYNLIQKEINNITSKDNTYYRIENDFEILETPNEIYRDINYLTSTTYSSISNQSYNEFYYDILNNNIPARNRALTVSTKNIMSNIINGNKYVISRGKPLQGYELIEENDGVNIYVNENVLPLGYATSNIMSYEDFNSLSDQVKQEALIKNIIADSKSNNDFITNVKPTTLDFKEILQDKNITENEDGSLTVMADDVLKINYTLPAEYQNKIIFIRFRMNRSRQYSDLAITINSVRNKLTANTWKYYNENEVFDYVLASQDQTKLSIKFNDGKYILSDFESYVLDYATLEDIKDNIDEFNIDRLNTKGDRIIGNIDVKEDGYFTMSIPYDNGFTIKIDGERQKVEKVNDAFIGCKITKGNHDIEIEYKAPLKDISLYISIFGILIFISVTYLESKKKI